MTTFFANGIVVSPYTDQGTIHIAVYGRGIHLSHAQVAGLRDCLNIFLGDQPPSVADDKVKALIQAAREWSGQFEGSKYLNTYAKQLYEAIQALDPPEDPDKALVAMIDSLIHNMTLRYDGESDRIRDVISLVREHDAKTVK